MVIAAAQEPVSGEGLVVAQQGLAQALGVGVGDAVADVVGDGAEVADVVVEPFGFQEQRAGGPGGFVDVDVQGVLDGHHVGQGVPDGGVAADPLGQLDALRGGAALEELLDAAVQEPQPGLDLQDGLADDGEPEVAGFDEPGVDRADGDLVDAVAFDGDERVGADVGAEPGGGVGVVAHRVVPGGPVAVPDQSLGQRVAVGADPVQVADLAFEPSGGEGARGPGWGSRRRRGGSRRVSSWRWPTGRRKLYTTRSRSGSSWAAISASRQPSSSSSPATAVS